MSILVTEAVSAAKGEARSRAQGAGRGAVGKAAGAPGAAARASTPGIPGGNKYQTAVLAEFLIAAGIVSFTPLATGGPPGKATVSPYQVMDLVQLLALGVTYFLLAVATGSERWGRVAAWFGLLVLLGLFYRKFATGELNAAVTGIHPGGAAQDSGGGTTA